MSILTHYFAHYLKLDDAYLVKARYPLSLLERRFAAIGEYEPPRATTKPKAPQEPVKPQLTDEEIAANAARVNAMLNGLGFGEVVPRRAAEVGS